MTENLIIFNARVVTPVGFSARRGREMEELCIIDDTGGIRQVFTGRVDALHNAVHHFGKGGKTVYFFRQ